MALLVKIGVWARSSERMGWVCASVLDEDGKLQYDVEDGTKIWFWHDLWQGEATFKERYPDLFLIRRDSEATVADYAELK